MIYIYSANIQKIRKDTNCTASFPHTTDMCWIHG